MSLGTFNEFFAGKSGDSIRFPSDTELADSIATNENAYAIAPQPRLVDILWELEEASRSNLAERHEKPRSLQVEHVMPRTWTQDWPFHRADYAAPFSDLPQAIARSTLINTLGNLTLVTGKLNTSVGNKSFEAKKKKFTTHTGLFLNKWFADYERWTETEIRKRGQRLAALAKVNWPSLESLSASD